MYESGKPAIVRCISTYRVNSFGQPDVSYLDITTLSTLSRVIRQLRGVITSKFKRVRLVSDGTLIGGSSSTVSPAIIRNEIISVYDDLITEGLVEDGEGFEAELVVERSLTDSNRVNTNFPVNLANQLRVFATKVDFVLQR
jgi:phage tail sheath gpL-like